MYCSVLRKCIVSFILKRGLVSFILYYIFFCYIFITASALYLSFYFFTASCIIGMHRTSLAFQIVHIRIVVRPITWFPGPTIFLNTVNRPCVFLQNFIFSTIKTQVSRLKEQERLKKLGTSGLNYRNSKESQCKTSVTPNFEILLFLVNPTQNIRTHSIPTKY